MDTLDVINALMAEGIPYGDARILAAVGKAESGFYAPAYGDADYGGSIGLFQINLPAHYDKLINFTGSESREDWINWLNIPENNILAAAAVYHSQGLGAWTMYNNGGYLQYLDGIYEVTGAENSSIPTSGGSTEESKKWTWNKIFENIFKTPEEREEQKERWKDFSFNGLKKAVTGTVENVKNLPGKVQEDVEKTRDIVKEKATDWREPIAKYSIIVMVFFVGIIALFLTILTAKGEVTK